MNEASLVFLVSVFIAGAGVGAALLVILEALDERRMSVEGAEKLLRAAKARAAAKAAYEKEMGE